MNVQDQVRGDQIICEIVWVDDPDHETYDKPVFFQDEGSDVLVVLSEFAQSDKLVGVPGEVSEGAFFVDLLSKPQAFS